MPRLALLVGGCAAATLLAAAGGARGLDAAGTCEMRLVDRGHASSARCLGCHDGTVDARAIAAKVHADGGPDHPVGVDYDEAWRARRTRLRPPGELPPGLPLVDGKVACTTCHDPRSPEPGRPALPMAGSAMCLACHDL